ncbi:cytochrome P450 [Nocardia rhamnosiphila]|uniref:cytochrome P450 n=1 Tax=Nocardia rhamnosiphila TaxID=426716 RepID=UPI00068E9987|nr:cytochrome P450 [Nocardia rhamnosiphila]
MSQPLETPLPSYDGRPIAPSSVIDGDDPRVAIYTKEFASDPQRVYRELRARYGSLVPVEIAPGVPATLVVDYETAKRILHDPEHFPADPRAWEANVPLDCPVRPMLQWRPNALRNTGAAHARLRSANTFAINGIDLHTTQALVEKIAVPLINGFCAAGHADLLAQFVHPLVFEVLNTLVGCSPDIGARVAQGMASIFDTSAGAEEGNVILESALYEQTMHKIAEPGNDITTRMIAHRAELTQEEVIHQLVVIYGAGIEPTVNLILNTLRLMLTDDRFGGGMISGSLSTADALDELLFTDPPLANFCFSYPRQPILIDGVWLPAHQPVLISMSACNNDSAVHSGDFTANRSHLAWGAGPHTCPAKDLSTTIARAAIDQLLDALPEMTSAVPVEDLQWRPGPYHRSLACLPVVFVPIPPMAV